MAAAVADHYFVPVVPASRAAAVVDILARLGWSWGCSLEARALHFGTEGGEHHNSSRGRPG